MPKNKVTPVLVGVGFADQRCDDPSDALEPCDLMAQAVEAAASDAGRSELIDRADAIAVPHGMWEYSDPARLVADRVGAGNARSMLTSIGILQQTLLNRACLEIQSGKSQIMIVVGGEARYRQLRAGILGKQAPETEQVDVAPDESLQSEDILWADLEAERGLLMPVEFYAILESAVRHARGQSVDEHRDALAQLYAGFSRIAEDNPHAWNRSAVTPGDVRDAVGKNRMISFPYTKLHNTQWNVDQASALILCSQGMAEEMGIDRDRWVFPIAGTEASCVTAISQRPHLNRSIGARLAGQAALELAGVAIDEIDHVDLYSCFPSAVQIFAEELGIDPARPLTVTGSMAFAGGPLNNYVLQSTARMAEVLRENPGSKGLVSCVSGIIGKQGFGIWSTEPTPNGFGHADVSEAVAAETSEILLDADYTGPATIVGYTVGYLSGSPAKATAVCDLPGGRRSVVTAADPDLLAELVAEEFCGRQVQILAQGVFAKSAD